MPSAMLLYGLDSDGKPHALLASPVGDGTWTLNIGVTDVTVGAVEIPAVGAADDPSWDGSGDGTLIAVSKAEYDRLTSLLDGLGGIADSPWSGTGDAGLISSTKGVWERLDTLLTDTNTKLDSIVSATSILATLQTILESIRDTQEANRDLLTQIETQDELIAANTAG